MPALSDPRAVDFRSRGRARRMSRRFASVGVVVPPSRLRELAGQAHLTDDEWVDINFALAATEIQRERHRAQLARARRRFVWWLIVAGACLAVLNALACLAFTMFSLAQHSPLL